MDALKRKILIRAIVVALLIGVVIIGVIVPPMYRELKAQNTQTLVYLLKTRMMLANQSLIEMQEVARQITSRSMIRDRLVEYNAGVIDLNKLQEYTKPLIKDALDKSRHALGTRRLDAQGRTVVEAGRALPILEGAPSAELTLHGPFQSGEEKTVIIRAPIHDRQNNVVGWDEVLFTMGPFRAVAGNYAELFENGEAILALVAGDRFVPHFKPRSEAAPALPPVTLFAPYVPLELEGWVLVATPLSDPNWWLIVRVPEAELTALINQNIRLIVAIALFLTLLAIPAMIWLIAPLLKRLAEEFKVREEAEAALKELNSNLERAIEEEITRRRQHEHILVHQARLAQMGEMIGAIAHQWRQPLNALALTVQDLTDAKQFGELDDAYLKEMTGKSMRLINQMSKTIDDFRGFFKSDREKQSFDPAKVVGESLELLKNQLEHHNIHIGWEPPAGPMVFTGFPNEFKQVVLNLVSNARDAIEEGRKEGRIDLLLRADERGLRLEVEDNGGGIPFEVAERIFEPYFTTKEEGKGVGLGLYMSKLIVEEHMGGRLFFENRENGVCFVALFPTVTKT